MLEVTEGKHRLRIQVERNVIAAHWLHAPTMKQMIALTTEMRKMCDRFGPTNCCFVDVIHGGVPDFRADVRDYVVKATRDPAMPWRGTAHLVLARGLVGTATRTFLSTVTLLARDAPPTKVFGEQPAAVRWLLERLEGGGSEWTEPQLDTVITDPETPGAI